MRGMEGHGNGMGLEGHGGETGQKHGSRSLADPFFHAHRSNIKPNTNLTRREHMPKSMFRSGFSTLAESGYGMIRFFFIVTSVRAGFSFFLFRIPMDPHTRFRAEMDTG